MSTAAKSNAETKKLPKPNNILMIPTSLDTDFFKWWCVFLRPFINLTNREIDVIAGLLKRRWELSKHISDSSILDTMVMSNETRKKILEECNITLKHYYVIINNFRKNKIIINNSLNPRLIPNIREDEDGNFQLLILFKINGK